MTVAVKARSALKRGQSRLKRHAEKTIMEFEFQIKYYQSLRRDAFDHLNRNELSGNQVTQIRDMVRKSLDRGMSPAECQRLLDIIGQPEKKKMTATEAKRIDQLNNKIRELSETLLPYMLPKLASIEHRPDDDTAETLKLIRARIAGEVVDAGYEEIEEPELLPAP